MGPHALSCRGYAGGDQIRLTREPPKTLFASLGFLGPGLIMSAAIVGSGELIATTALGAKTGFLLLWVILVSCLVKVAIQLEYGRDCIFRGRSSFHAWNQGKGAKVLGVHWSVALGAFSILIMFIVQAGVLGGTAQIISSIFPGVPITASTALLVLLVALLLKSGSYRRVEVAATVFNLIFAVTIGFCVFQVQSTPYGFALADLASGFAFRLPSEAVALAMGAFGITGIGALEIFMYPYWCLEKGYAAWTGPHDGSEDWMRRAKGWTRVMQIDALVSLLVYTSVTCGFYFLGASVLRHQPALSDGNDLVLQLSGIFTQVLGNGSRNFFMLGAFTILFSTVVVATASYARVWSDLFVVWNIEKESNRRRTVILLSWVIPVIWAVIYLSFQYPLYLVTLMGILSTIFLILVVYQALGYRYASAERGSRRLLPRDVFLWLSTISIALIALKALYSVY